MANPDFTDNELSMLAQTSENQFLARVVIANGEAESTAVPTQGRVLVGIFMPQSWTAANLGYKASADGVNFSDLVVDSGGNLVQAQGPTANDFIAFPETDAVKAPYMRLVSMTAAGVATNQGAARTIILVFSRYLGGQ